MSTPKLLNLRWSFHSVSIGQKTIIIFLLSLDHQNRHPLSNWYDCHNSKAEQKCEHYAAALLPLQMIDSPSPLPPTGLQKAAVAVSIWSDKIILSLQFDWPLDCRYHRISLYLSSGLAWPGRRCRLEIATSALLSLQNAQARVWRGAAL